jgi:Flp pilus assembly protein TadG
MTRTGRRKPHGIRQRAGITRGERGSFAVELAILAPVILAFLVMVIDGGRLTWAGSRLQGAARDAARAVSINHNSGQQAFASAEQAMTDALANSGVDCDAPTLTLDPDPRTTAIGNDDTVSATVTCDVQFVMVGSHTLSRTQQSVVDRYRQVTTGPAGGGAP